MSGINRFFFKNQEENAAVVRLYGVEKKNPPGRREGVAAMKKRLMVSLAVLMALWGGQALAQSAVVNNGSDPNSRLNMRDQPSRDASAVGQFYTGTPVEIVADAGDGWSQVTIGGGVNSLSGYMMTRYLSFNSHYVTPTPEVIYVTPAPTPQIVYVTPTPTPLVQYITPKPAVPGAPESGTTITLAAANGSASNTINVYYDQGMTSVRATYTGGKQATLLKYDTNVCMILVDGVVAYVSTWNVNY